MPNAIRLALCLLVVGCAAVGGCAERPVRPVAEAEAPGLPAEQLAKAGLTEYWNTKLSGMRSGEAVVRIVRTGDLACCVTNLARVLAVRADTGVEQWTYQARDGANAAKLVCPVFVRKVVLSESLPGIKRLTGHASAANSEPFDAVMFNTLSEIVVLRQKDGHEMRRVAISFPASSPGTSDGAFYYVGAADGAFFAIDLELGLEAWRLFAGGMVVAPLEAMGNLLYVGSTASQFRALHSGKTWQKAWTQEVAGPIIAPFQVNKQGCFVPCQNRRLYCFSPQSGAPVWPVPFITGGALRSAVQVGENTVFQRAEGDKLYAVNIANGQERWSLEEGEQVLAIIGGDVYLRDVEGNLRVVEEMTGKLKAGPIPLTGLDRFVGSTGPQEILAGASFGRIVCFRPRTGGFVAPRAPAAP